MSSYGCYGDCDCCSGQQGLFWTPRRNFMRGASVLALGAGLGGVAGDAMASPAGALYNGLWQKPRVLTLYRKETGEGGAIEYWRNGRLLRDGWRHILYLMRDVEAGLMMPVDPTVVNIVWGVQEWARLDMDKTYVFRLTDGIRSEGTNKRVGGAPGSRHMKGDAIDGSFENLSLRKYADAARFFAAGGVGLYDTHVHVDCGRVKNWRG